MTSCCFNMRDRKVTPFLNSRFDETYPEFSPDGRWMAYVSDESGRDEVYVQPFPGPGASGRSPTRGVRSLCGHGTANSFSTGVANQVWVVDVQTGSGFSASKPRLLFEQPGYATE